MPILWKYLVRNYFQFFFLCVSSFVAILLIIRFQDIALFASSGAKIHQIGLFTLYQIPYILPIAIPISSLIACMILFQRMSASLEITAFRAAGISLKTLIYPLLLFATLLSVINFTIISELTPLTRTLAKDLIYRIASSNPLIVMQKDSALDLKTFDFDLKNLDLGKKAEEVICIMRQNSSDRIGLFTAKELSIDEEFINGKGLSILSSVDPGFDSFDHLVIENQEKIQLSKPFITNYLFSTEWFSKDDLLSFKEVLQKCLEKKQFFRSKPVLELVRRSCLGLCAFTFTLIGISFGLDISRRRKKTGLMWALFLSLFILISFIAAKTMRGVSPLLLLLYLLPQPVAIFLSCRALNRISHGVES
jgi:lipopolysaccharide export system permease protein